MKKLKSPFGVMRTIDLGDKLLAHQMVSQMLFWDRVNTFRDIADETRLNIRTISNLAYGKTKSAHMSTITAVGEFYGYRSVMYK